ncbi:hypothetical protein TIFTF001_006094 [Ficus carica]|uniref:F-box domain-containing protein n=1 Tax=Ficus carica TaxID=3494 RepID=A0AA87ZN59_FICCA|nr:hypothetical protein TIFTF001_006094 [Ficus carica]
MVEIKEPIGIGGFGVNCCIVQKHCTFKQSCKQQKCPKTSLPWEIIVDILFRLPVKDLLRYRSVAKSWCSLIDGPDFVKLHLDHSKEANSNLAAILSESNNLFWVDLDVLSDAAVKLNHPFDDCS